MGSISVAAGSLDPPATYSYITTLHNDRSKVIVNDHINNLLYVGTLDTFTWEIFFHLKAGSGAQGTNYGCGDATEIPSLRALKSDDIVPNRVWSIPNGIAEMLTIDIGTTEICLSAAYTGTYNSNFIATTSEIQNGYIYTSFNEKIGGLDAHVFKVDLFADPLDWSDYGVSTSTQALVDDSQQRHL
eukprot:163546-Rhodomonas_salina.1